jgi:hypothetical protein
MIIHYARRWVYLGVPKTGSTTMHLLLSRPPFGGEDVYGMGNEQHRMEIPPGCDDYLTFATVRDPIARAMSLYRQFHKAHRDLPGGSSFPEFVACVLHGEEHRRRYGRFFCATQAEWLRGLRVDRVLRLEHLRDDLERLGLVDEPFELPRANVSRVELPDIDPTTLARVRAWAAADYDFLGG